MRPGKTFYFREKYIFKNVFFLIGMKKKLLAQAGNTLILLGEE